MAKAGPGLIFLKYFWSYSLALNEIQRDSIAFMTFIELSKYINNKYDKTKNYNTRWMSMVKSMRYHHLGMRLVGRRLSLCTLAAVAADHEDNSWLHCIYRVLGNCGPKVFAYCSPNMSIMGFLCPLGAPQMWSIWISKAQITMNPLLRSPEFDFKRRIFLKIH